MSWLKREQKEEPQDCLDRAFAVSQGRGVARGDSSLGVRFTAAEHAANRKVLPHRAYKIWPVAADWSQ